MGIHTCFAKRFCDHFTVGKSIAAIFYVHINYVLGFDGLDSYDCGKQIIAIL